MHIFEYIDNENFFKPFVSKNRKLYFDCICLLINKSKENANPILFDSDARDCINIYLNRTKFEYIEEKDEDGNIYASKDGTSILRIFRDCGWLSKKELGKNGEYETYVTSNCRRVIDFLMSLVNQSEDGNLTNHILSMYEILKEVFSNDGSVRSIKPYENILKPLVSNMEALKEELYVLNEKTSKIMKTVMDSQNMKSFGSFMLKDEFLEKFFSEYFFIKNNGTISILLSEILNYIRKLNTDEWIDSIAENYKDIKKLEISEAKVDIQNMIYELHAFIDNEYQIYIDQIERQINNYYSLAHAKMMMFQKNGINMEVVIDRVLCASKTMDSEKREEMFQRIAECITINPQKYIGIKSFARKKRERKEEKEQVIVENNPSEQELEQLSNQVLNNSNPYSLKKAKKFLEQKMKDKECFELKNEEVHDCKEALMYAVIMAFASVKEFDYEIKIFDELVDFGFIKISNMQIKKGRDKNA